MQEVYREIRKQVGPDYPVGIKINSADFQKGGFSESESMEVIQLLSNEGMDLIEISGGTYEKPAMVKGSRKQSTIEREAYFLEYIEKVRKITDKPLLLTGGFRTVKVMENALAEKKLDLIGLGRPFCLYPNLAQDIFNRKETIFKTPLPTIGIKLLDKLGGIELPWYELQIQRLGKGKDPKPNLAAIWALLFTIKEILLKSFFKELSKKSQK